jgi:hypothetical protein
MRRTGSEPVFPLIRVNEFPIGKDTEKPVRSGCGGCVGSDSLPCAVLSCSLEQHSIEMCKAEACCYRWQRDAAEDRTRRQERDRKERMRHEA